MRNRASAIQLCFIFVLSLLLTGCQPGLTQTDTDFQSATAETTSSAATTTASPSPTLAFTSTPTFSPTVTPVHTQTSIEIGLAQTPLPDLVSQINTSNTDLVTPLAIWGNGSANGISLSQDGQVLAVATNLGAFFYDSLSYKQVALISTALPVRSIAFSANNQQAALCLSDASIEIIDLLNFSSLTRLPGTSADLDLVDQFTVSFSPDGSELFEVIEEADFIQIRRWKVSNWLLIADFYLNPGWAVYTSASLDLIGIVSNNDLSLQSLTDPEEKDQLTLPTSIAPSFWNRIATEGGDVLTSSSGEFILISNGIAIAHWDLLAEGYTYLLDDYPSHLPDPCSQAPDTCLNVNGGYSWSCGDEAKLSPIEGITLTPDDVMVLISRNDNLTEFRGVSDNYLLWEIETTFTDVVFSPGGEFFFGLKIDGTVEKRSTLDGELLDFLDLHPGQLFSMAFSVDNGILAAGFSDGWIRVLSAGSGEVLGVLTGTARSLQFSPDGTLLAAGLDDGTVRIFLLQEGRYYDIAPGHLAAVTDLVFSFSGDLLLTGSADCTSSLWDVSGRYRVQTRIPSPKTPYRLTQVLLDLNEETRFLSGNGTGIVTFTGLGAESLLLHGMTIHDLALSPDNAFLAAAGEGLFLIYLPDDSIADLNLHTEDQEFESYAAAFDPSGTLLADATLEEIRFWSVREPILLGSVQVTAFVSAENPPVTLAFSPDGTLVALATTDGLIQIFGIPASIGN